MADVSYSINAQVSKGSLSQAFAAFGVTADIATAGMMSVTLDLGPQQVVVSTASLSSLGLCFARSLVTTTHTVSFGRYSGEGIINETFLPTIRLRGGEAAILRLAPGDYGAVADVEGSRLLLTVLED
jgi:hypothetical protein